MRRIIIGIVAAAAFGAVVASVWAATINGTKGNDNLRGTARADSIFGNTGNDVISGLAGNDLLNGGPGNDRLIGGPGRDRYVCGTGRDTVVGDAQDVRPGKDCEVVRGIPAPPPPATTTTTTTTPAPPPPPPPTARAGHYTGQTSQGKPISFDVSADSKNPSLGRITGKTHAGAVIQQSSHEQKSTDTDLTTAPDEAARVS